MCPNVVHNCLNEVGGGRSTMIAILEGFTNNPYLHTKCPKNTPKGEKKIHFFKFREIWHFPHLSNINLKHSIWSFIRIKIVQLSKYASKNLCKKFLNASTTTLENMVGAFFKPKGITVYWKEPYFVANVVLYRSSLSIMIWW